MIRATCIRSAHIRSRWDTFEVVDRPAVENLEAHWAKVNTMHRTAALDPMLSEGLLSIHPLFQHIWTARQGGPTSHRGAPEGPLRRDQRKG